LDRYQRADQDRQETAPTRLGKSADRARPGPGEPTATLLDLQSRAGNAAVGGLLAGGGPTVLRLAIQREEETAEATATKGAGDEGARPGVAMLASPGLKAPIPLQSFSDRRSRRPAGTGGSGETGGTGGASGTSADIDVTIRVEDFDLALQSAAAQGITYDTMSISVAWGSYILENVVVASVVVGKTLVSATLNCSSFRLAP